MAETVTSAAPRGTPHTGIHPLYLRLQPPDIARVKFLFESYEEVAVVRTVDRRAAIIVVLVVEDFLPTARAILREVQRDGWCSESEAVASDIDDWLMREIRGAAVDRDYYAAGAPPAGDLPKA